jgi:uncharacterized protein YyaL (SSP411 family)
VMLVSKDSQEGFPLLEGRVPTRESTLFVCKNQTCQPSVQSPEDALKMLLTKS